MQLSGYRLPVLCGRSKLACKQVRAALPGDCRLAPAEGKTVAESMVRHERSLLEVARRELAGDTNNSVELVVAQRAYPLSPSSILEVAK